MNHRHSIRSHRLTLAPRGNRDVASTVAEALKGVADNRLAQPPFPVRFWDGSSLEPADPEPEGPVAATKGTATLVVRDPSALAHLLHAPNQLGLVRAWVAGALDLEGDLEPVLGARARYQDLHVSRAERLRLAWAAARLNGSTALRRPSLPAIEARPSGRRHSIERDRQAVQHHYELSNEFYERVLGPSMVYSCAYFEHPDEPLDAAQERKLETICRKLRLRAGDRLLDIGCGWGSLLLHAAAHHGVSGVGVTLSEAQGQLARERVSQAGLSDRVQIRVCDYRQIADGPFDKIASVGMYEHVGRDKLEEYVGVVRDLLAPGGLFLNHGIARLHDEPRSRDTFIARYVFPDGELHPVTSGMLAMEAAGLEIRDLESLREHYVLTLRRWVANLDAAWADAVREVGAPRARVWRLYMLGSAQAFETGEIGVYQVLAARDGAPHRLPLTRAELLAGQAEDSPRAGARY